MKASHWKFTGQHMKFPNKLASQDSQWKSVPENLTADVSLQVLLSTRDWKTSIAFGANIQVYTVKN